LGVYIYPCTPPPPIATLLGYTVYTDSVERVGWRADDIIDPVLDLDLVNDLDLDLDLDLVRLVLKSHKCNVIAICTIAVAYT